MRRSVLALVTMFGMAACGAGTGGSDAVVIYTSVDQNFSEPVLEDFEAETGIEVRAVYDLEAAKTTGLVNRLIAEAESPQADVWWNGEFSQPIQLAEAGLLEAYRSPAAEGIPETMRDGDWRWTGFGGRARVILVNTERMDRVDWPRSVHDLLDAGREAEDIGIAYPVFGTTATQAAAHYALWGEDAARRFYAQVADRELKVLDGNSVVRDQVADGQLAWGLTDTDDACGAVERGAPVEIVFPDQEEGEDGTLIVPNTVALVRGGPNPEAGRRFIDWLLREETVDRLIADGWIQLSLREGGASPACVDASNVKAMPVSLTEVAGQIEHAIAEMTELFVR